MVKNEGSSGKGSTEVVEVDQSSVYAVNPSDYTGVSLINCKLNGSNYLTWSRAMMMALTAKNKVGMVDGSVPRPPDGDPNRVRWDMCNALVISWIFNTLDSELQTSVACATVAQSLWEDLRESVPGRAGPKTEMQGNQTYGGHGGSRGGGSGSKTCYHCGRPGHVKSACWLLHGRPTNWEAKPAKENRLGFSGKRDRTSRRTIGVGKLQGGVYYLRRVGIQEQANQVISDEADDLWHMRLGHL
ncbi:hypothetical protein CRG98_028397 [Punica granatum]|uniref:CCHC-type domain-containing protein n=1 Tax=Punica granatum TaxID=22663 RepID=A0A2I0J5J9_PUNGR|nr:hypothetical protein CRG98_028397 [Punica granatum]